MLVMEQQLINASCKFWFISGHNHTKSFSYWIVDIGNAADA